MQSDTISYDNLDGFDSLNSLNGINSSDRRPLPKWLVDQKSGLTSIQPEEIHMKEDHSLKISSIVTLTFIILLLVFLTYYFNRKHKNQAS